jgi:pSer/pThr/pTyr-binding forkhead associated (FHA) protein
MRAHLVPIKGGGRPIQITRDVTLVGRQDDLCDICLETTSVSKMHCLIVRTDGLLFIRDLGSTNGTKVNGQRVVRGALLPGDELAFAGEKFRVEMGPGEPDVEEHESNVENAYTQEIELPQKQLEENFASYPLEPMRTSDSDVRFLEEDE